MLLMNLLKQFLKSNCIVNEWQKKHFNKNLIMSKEEEQFQLSNMMDDDDENVRVHRHITGKYRGTAHWDCNINLQLNRSQKSMVFF